VTTRIHLVPTYVQEEKYGQVTDAESVPRGHTQRHRGLVVVLRAVRGHTRVGVLLVVMIAVRGSTQRRVLVVVLRAVVGITGMRALVLVVRALLENTQRRVSLVVVRALMGHTRVRVLLVVVRALLENTQRRVLVVVLIVNLVEAPFPLGALQNNTVYATLGMGVLLIPSAPNVMQGMSKIH